MSAAKRKPTSLVERHFTTPGTSPYDEIEWEHRTARIGSEENPVFEQHNVEVPSFWSQNATNIVAQKYFAYGEDDPRRESSVREMIDRVVGRITDEGRKSGHLRTKAEAETFAEELRYILVHQLAFFNSPVWFNIGVEGRRQCPSACFILSVEDSLDSIANWNVEEMKIFQAGSGAGVNLSNLRASMEPLSNGGVSSGPVTFMRGADANAGTIQSGGTTRRAAKLVCLDVDHPDVEDFIWCKAREEERIHALQRAGFEIGLGSKTGERNLAEATAYQNANNSVRVTDEFMKAVEEDAEWELVARRSGEVIKRVKARELLEQIADAAWRCADPGLQYDTTINDWHTTPSHGRITASNPCSEFLSNDNTSCNLASLNLLRFLDRDGNFDIESFRHTVRVIFLAEDILISFAELPTRKIQRNTQELRQIGLGYTNLGALLMSLGLAYDSDDGRAWAAAVTALMCGESYLQSTRIAEALEPFTHYEANAESVKRVLAKHRAEARKLEGGPADVVRAARSAWDEVVRRAAKYGVRNAQATVLAPTGTISFAMDADTMGCEPDFALVKHKVLAGGGTMTIVNQALPRALTRLGYEQAQINEIVAYVEEEVDGAPRNSVVGAPHLAEEHYPVFDCAVGERSISPEGHVRMMAAIQPFLSGAISKTVNLPAEVTVEDIRDLYVDAWKLGLKALAIYRDGSKASQPLASKAQERTPEAEKAAEARLTSLLGDGLLRGERREIARDAKVEGVNFEIGTPGQMVGGYVHVRLFDDGTPGALFVDVGQAGSTLHGFIRAWAVTFSLGLQYGVPLDVLVSKLAFAQFEPSGWTDDPNVRRARSIVDFVVRWLAARYLDPAVHAQLGILGTQPADEAEAAAVADPDEEETIPGGTIATKTVVRAATVPSGGEASSELKLTAAQGADVCAKCSGLMVRTGTCMTCSQCGETGGCG